MIGKSIGIWLSSALCGFLLSALVMLDYSTSQAATTSVYECVVEGRHTFSDQPCGANAQSREIAEANRMVAQDTQVLSRHEPSIKSRQVDDDDVDKKKAACNKVREQQAQVLSQQRAGYSAKQGERLRVRHDQLLERYASLRCERYR